MLIVIEELFELAFCHREHSLPKNNNWRFQKILKLETTKPYKIRINDQNGRDVIQKFDPKNINWEEKSPDFLDKKYCLTNYKGHFHTNEPVMFNTKDMPKLEKNTELVFADTYEFNYHLNFTIPLGSKVLIKGESGTGKSLIIKAISDNYRLGYGAINLPEKSSIIHVTQNSIVDWTKTWREELLSNLTKEEANLIQDSSMEALIKKYFADQTGEVQLDKTIGRLSGGQEQRFVLCRLLLKDPKKVKLITLDEPFGAVDSTKELEYLEDIYNHFNNPTESQDKTTILTISHSEIKNDDGNNSRNLLTLHNGMLETKIADQSMFSNTTVGKTYSEVQYKAI